QPVHHDRLFYPLAAGVVPVGEAVEHHVVLAWLAQVERLDGDAIDLDADRVALELDRAESLDDLLVTNRPADVGPEREPDLPRDVAHCSFDPWFAAGYSYTNRNG